MKLVQSRLCWLLTLFLGLSIVAGIASMAQVQGASHQQFTLTEVDPIGDRVAGWWQYRAVANTAPGGFSRHQDSPWHWRHYGQYEIDNYGANCGDNIFALYPANPNSPDTAVSADGGTITVNIYQEIDTVWICFALECDDGTFAYAQMRNLQTETTVSGNGCGEGSSSDTTQSPPPDNNNNGGNNRRTTMVIPTTTRGTTMVIPTTTRGTTMVIPTTTRGTTMVIPTTTRGTTMVIPTTTRGTTMVAPSIRCCHQQRLTRMVTMVTMTPTKTIAKTRTQATPIRPPTTKKLTTPTMMKTITPRHPSPRVQLLYSPQ